MSKSTMQKKRKRQSNQRGNSAVKNVLKILPMVILLISILIFPAEAGEQQEPVTVTQSIILEQEAQAEEVSEEIIEEIPVDTPEEIEEEMYYDSLELLAICVEAEAGNQPLDGRRMVVDAILNRVDDPDFPDTIEGVITQPYHFSSYWDGNMDSITEISELTYTAVQMELEERGWPQLFYFTAGDYSEYGTPWKKVGDHYFSTK